MTTFQRIRRNVSVLALWAAWSAAGTPADEVAFPRDLAVSPDGQTLAFGWAGDIWAVPITGGLATRLTVHPARDAAPVWSRDGRRIAFSSTRFGAANVFVMDRDGGGLARVTFGDRPATPSTWSLDDQMIYFDSNREGQDFREPKVYRVPAAGGQPWRVMDCFGAGARLSPDGRHLAFVRGRLEWWRRGYRGSGNTDIWLLTLETGLFTQLTDFDGTDRLPCWDAEGRGLYFLSDRAGTVNVWYQPIDGGVAQQVTHMTGDDVRDLSVAATQGTLAFTHWDKVYVLSLPDGSPQAITIRAGSDSPLEDIDWRTLHNNADETEPSPDGSEMALVVRGEIFVTKTEENRPTRRVTDSPARDRHVNWSPDGKALFFVSDRNGVEEVYRARSAEKPAERLADSLRFTIEQVTDGDAPCFSPKVSPDGQKLAYFRVRGDLVIRDLKTGEERVLRESWNAPDFAWSPDSQWIAYEIEDREHNPDVWVVRADGSEPAVNISQHPDYDGHPQWSSDGRILAFSSKRAGFDSDLYLVFLAPELDEMSDADREEYFQQQAESVKKRKPPKSVVASGKIRLAGQAATSEPATKPTAQKAGEAEGATEESAEQVLQQLRRLLKGVLEEPKTEKKEGGEEDGKQREKKKEYRYELSTAYRRVRVVTHLPEDQTQFALSPDGSLLAFVSSHEGDPKLFSVKWNGQDRKQLVAGSASHLRWDLTGGKLFYLKGGVPNSCPAGGSGAKAHAFRAKMVVDFTAEAEQKFNDAARALGRGFYHPTLKGLDWAGLTNKYRALALRTRTVTEFNEVFDMLQGELNASHLGISGGERSGRSGDAVGYLGCDFDPSYAGPGLRVAAITPRGPADRVESKLHRGDVLRTVNGRAVGPSDPLDRALIDTVGDPVVIGLVPAPQEVPEHGAASAPASTSQASPTSAAEEGGAQHERSIPPGMKELVIRPVSYATYADLQYQAWADANRKYVEEHSGGRIGYCHIRGMSAPGFDTFERDLYAAGNGKEGLIVDVRNNGGGWTADWIMAVLNVKRYAYTIARGGEPGFPQDRLIFYSWTKPATMMCNQYSFSNAEIVSHAFKTTRRGPLVGQTTFGGVISTGSYELIDGASIRMPSRGWYVLPDGVDMELHGAEPDVRVFEGPADEVAGRQPQLDAAIRATLPELERNAAP